MVFRSSWISAFVRAGYFHFPGLVSKRTVSTARRLIDDDLAENYDPARKAEYDSRSFCPDLLGTPDILALLHNRAVKKRIGELVSHKTLALDTQGQIALRRAHKVEHPSAPVAHVDGFPAPYNGVEGGEVIPFTMLVGVFLSEVKTEFAGNFTVWPGSHFLVEEYFNHRGPQSVRKGLPKLSLGKPVQLLGSPGDVVICHYALAHAAAANVSDHDRYACFFRLWHHELYDRANPEYRALAWTHLTNIWTGWKVSP